MLHFLSNFLLTFSVYNNPACVREPTAGIDVRPYGTIFEKDGIVNSIRKIEEDAKEFILEHMRDIPAAVIEVPFAIPDLFVADLGKVNRLFNGDSQGVDFSKFARRAPDYLIRQFCGDPMIGDRRMLNRARILLDDDPDPNIYEMCQLILERLARFPGEGAVKGKFINVLNN